MSERPHYRKLPEEVTARSHSAVTGRAFVYANRLLRQEAEEKFQNRQEQDSTLTSATKIAPSVSVERSGEHPNSAQFTTKLPEPLYRADGVQVYPLPAVAASAGLSPERLRQLTAEGRLTSVRPGRDIYISIDDVQAYLTSPRKRSGPAPKPRKPRTS